MVGDLSQAKYKVGDLKGEPVKVDKEHLELAHIVKNTLKEAGAHPLGSAPILQVRTVGIGWLA